MKDARDKEAAGIVTITVSGDQPLSRFEALVGAIMGQADDTAPLRLLFDVRPHPGEPPSPERLKHAAFRLSTLRRGLGDRHAVVVRDAFQYGLAREIAGWAGAQGVEVGVFRTIEEAETWLST